MAPIASARMVRGSRISRTITCATSLPPPNSASITASGDSRTGPMPSEISASSTTSASKRGRHAEPAARGGIGRQQSTVSTLIRSILRTVSPLLDTDGSSNGRSCEHKMTHSPVRTRTATA